MSEEEEEESQSDEERERIGITDYEKQRLERIKENKARLEALRLPTLASSLFKFNTTLQHNKTTNTRKGKQKNCDDDDDEYKPSSEQGSSSEEEHGEDDDDGSPKGKTPQSLKKRKPKSKASAKKHMRKLDFVDDDEALQQAIALSLDDSSAIMGAGHPGHGEKCRADLAAIGHHERKGRTPVQEEADKRKKRRGLNTGRMQISEDQVIIHFFQFDEAGKGGITVKDLQRVAVDHDFSWSDKEMADMIHLFDNHGNGRLNLEDFRKILHRCNMIKGMNGND